MEWMVAPSYANATILKVDEEMRKALIEQTCDRCGGAGYYALGTHNGMPVLSPHDGGVCYECGGSGKIRKMVKAYTAEEYNKYVQAQTRAKERKEEKRAAEAAKREAESETNKRAWLAENDIPVDWSGYTKLVFVYAEPTTVNTQGFVQTTTEDHKWWGNTGITKLECPFDGKDMSQVKQVALQASDVATIVITDIYLVQSADGIEEKVMVPASIINNGAVYNLAGQKVDASYKGIVIQNGRKFIQK